MGIEILMPMVILLFMSGLFITLGMFLRSVGRKSEMNPYGSGRHLRKIQKLGQRIDPKMVRQGARTFMTVGTIFMVVGFGMGLGAWTLFYYGTQ